jgi:hypothetical protein
LIKKIDEITFLAESQGRVFIVWEWENQLALSFHLIERKLKKNPLLTNLELQ